MIHQEVLICSISYEYCISSMIFEYVHISYLLKPIYLYCVLIWRRQKKKKKLNKKTPT